MKLKYPLAKDLAHWQAREYPNILHDSMFNSPYYLIGIAESGWDVYVAFTNKAQDQVWIEKSHGLYTGIYFQTLQQIDSNEEFDRAYKFFIQQGILDGIESSRKSL